MLREISRQVPELKFPDLAKTKKQKEKLLKTVSSGKHSDTAEGVVVYNLHESRPTKAKIRKDYDVYIKGMFEGTGRLKGKMVGGLLASRTPDGPAIVRIGGGWSDAQRKDMYENPDKYINRLAKVYAMQEFASGKLRMPIFKE